MRMIQGRMEHAYGWRSITPTKLGVSQDMGLVFGSMAAQVSSAGPDMSSGARGLNLFRLRENDAGFLLGGSGGNRNCPELFLSRIWRPSINSRGPFRRHTPDKTVPE
jgi:hypothetical protein